MKKTNSRTLQAKRTKRKLLRNAIKLIEKNGFDNVTIEDICKVSKLSVGAFYHYFSSKTDIITELYMEIDDYFEDEVAGKLGKKSAIDDLIVFFSHFARFISDQKYFHVSVLYATRNEVLIDKERFMYVCLNEIIQKGQEKGEIKGTYETGFIEDFLFVLARGTIFDWILNKGEYDLEEKMKANFEVACPVFFTDQA